MSCKRWCWVCSLAALTPRSALQGCRRWGLAAATGKDKGLGMGCAINKAIQGNKINGIIQTRSSLCKHWFWLSGPGQRAMVLETPAAGWRKQPDTQMGLKRTARYEGSQALKKLRSECPGSLFRNPEVCTSSRNPFFPSNQPCSDWAAQPSRLPLAKGTLRTRADHPPTGLLRPAGAEGPTARGVC